MMITIDFTYQTVTPESAEQGDFEEDGFIAPGMWRYPGEGYKRNCWTIGDLAGLIDFAQSLGITHDGDHFYSVDPDVDYTTGSSTTYGMHLAGVTVSTEMRIARLLEAG